MSKIYLIEYSYDNNDLTSHKEGRPTDDDFSSSAATANKQEAH
jgi:hypothetical protein